MNNEQEIADLEELFRSASKRADVEPVFEDENGEEHYLPQEAVKVIEDILDTCFIPFLAKVTVAAGYRKADASFERYLLDKHLHSAENYCAYCAKAPENEACLSENVEDCYFGIREFYEKLKEEKYRQWQ